MVGVAIASLDGENGLLTNVKLAKKAQIKAEMKEQLVLALTELQLEKNGEATLDDVTQEWADSILEGYKPTITSDASINGKKITMSKSGEVVKYIIDEKLNIIETEETTGSELTYEVKSRDGENLQVLVIVTDNENGLQTIEYNDGHIQDANGLKSVSRDCTIQLGVEYRVKIISKNGEEKTETILINDYYHTITKNLGEGISIDNIAVKTAYNQPYQATITTENDYILETLTVTMAGEEVTVDKTTGVINIEKVTGDIEIIATANKLEKYGMPVNYSANGITNWSVFYIENDETSTNYENIYLISSQILPVSKLPTDIYAIKDTTYNLVNWSQSSPKVEYKEITDDVREKFMFTYNKSTTNWNIKTTSNLLNTSSWSSFANGTSGSINITESYAIGGPTIEMFVASWNEVYPMQKLTTTIGENGYFVNESANVELPSDTGKYYKLIMECGSGNQGYWIASPSYTNNTAVFCIKGYLSKLNCDSSTNTNYAKRIRPVVCIPSKYKLQYNSITELYDIVER